MSPWGLAGGGPMNDQQISNIIAYIASIQIPMAGCKEGEIICDTGHLPLGDPTSATPQPYTSDEIQRAAEAAVAAGTYKSLGEALFNLDLNSGAYSCARCHTTGWSYGDPQQSGGGAMGPNLTSGATVRQFPSDADQVDFVSSGSVNGKKLRPAGPGLGPHARLRPAPDPGPDPGHRRLRAGAVMGMTQRARLRLEPGDPGHHLPSPIGVVVLCGSVYLLLGTNLGARLGFLVALAALFGWLTLHGQHLVGLRHRALGLQGRPPAWVAKEVVVGDLSPVERQRGRRQRPDHARVREACRPTTRASARPSPPPTTSSSPRPRAFNGEQRLQGRRRSTTRAASIMSRSGAPSTSSPSSTGPTTPSSRSSPVIPQDTEPGRAPPTPIPDPSQPPVYVVMERDLGTQRVPPASVIMLGSGIIFALSLLSCCTGARSWSNQHVERGGAGRPWSRSRPGGRAVGQYLPIVVLAAAGALFGALSLVGVEAARPEAAERGQGGALRVRHRARRGPAGAVPGELLPGGDAVHHVRHRDHVPLPVRGGAGHARGVRLLGDPRVQRRVLPLVRVRGGQGRARLGSAAPARRLTDMVSAERTAATTIRRVGLEGRGRRGGAGEAA